MSSSSSSGNIAAMAAKIQDNILRLSSERAVLELLQAEQDEKQGLLDEAQEECAEVRKEYLSTLRANYGIELELWQVRGKKNDCVEAIENLQEETKNLQEYKREIQTDWEELVVNDILANHEVNQMIYRHSMETSIGQREELMQKRTDQLGSLTSRMETLRNNEVAMKEEKKRILHEMDDFKRTEQQDDEELAKLAEEVKEMIAKRSNLRKSLREHKKTFEEANQETLQWEKECVELATQPED